MAIESVEIWNTGRWSSLLGHYYSKREKLLVDDFLKAWEQNLAGNIKNNLFPPIFN